MGPSATGVAEGDFGVDSLGQVNAVVAILGGRQHQFGFGDVATIEIQRTRFGVLVTGGIMGLQGIGPDLPVSELTRVGWLVEPNELLLKVLPHGLAVVAARFKGLGIAAKSDFREPLAELLDAPLTGDGVAADDRDDRDHWKGVAALCHRDNPLVRIRRSGKPHAGRSPAARITVFLSHRFLQRLIRKQTLMHNWIAKRTEAFDSSGIRRVFDLAAKLDNPINLSIGQPDFPVPDRVRKACIDAIESGKNAYSQTQGIGPLRDRLQADVQQRYGHDDRQVFVSSGTSGGLVLAMLAMVDPGDEVLFFDPYFVMYPALVRMVGGVPVMVDSYPDFRIDCDRVAAKITDRTKMIIVNSPANPTGVTASREELRDLAQLAADRDIALVSDEIYSSFMYDEPFTSPAEFNRQTIVIDGFSKSHAMTGWRVGYVHGPEAVISTMVKLQQYTFVCAPQPAQWAGLEAMDVDLSEHLDAYRRKRDFVIDGLRDKYELTVPGGAFYVFPKAPGGSGSKFVETAISRGLLIIPGNIFSVHDSHFRISFAASDETLQRGVDLLRELA